MSVDALTILKEAQKYIGVTGGSQKHKFIVDTYNSVKPLPQSYVHNTMMIGVIFSLVF